MAAPAAFTVLLAAAAFDVWQPLLPGAPVEKPLASGEVHRYEIEVSADRYAQVTVEQEGIDLLVRVVAADGALLTEVNNPGGADAAEVVSFLPGSGEGVYRLELHPQPGEDAGSYRIAVREEREARPDDRLRVAAERAEAAADQLYQRRPAGGLDAALTGYRSALEGWRTLGERGKESEVLHRLGIVQRLRGEAAEALDFFGQALAIARVGGDRGWQAAILNQRGLTHLGQSRLPEALADFEEALALRRALGEERLEAPILNNIGLVHQRSGDARRAQAAYRGALELFRRAGDRLREGRTLGNLGGTHHALGEPTRALELLEQALAVARSVDDRAGEAEWLNFLGVVRYGLGEPMSALESYDAAFSLFREMGDRRRQAVALGNRGALFLEIGEPERALDAFEQALSIHREIGARAEEAVALTGLGRALSRLDRPAEALERFAHALAIEREVGDRANEASTLGDLGFHHAWRGNPREALPLLEASLALWRELGDRADEARALHSLGLAQSRLGEAEAALAAFGEALRLRRALGDPAGEAAALQEMARTELRRGRLAAARAHLEPALERIESLRLRIAADRLRSSYFASLGDAYELSVELLMSLHAQQPGMGHDARAFETAERARARSLVDLLREARVEIRRGADPRLLEEEHRLRLELQAKSDRLLRLQAGDLGGARAAEARRELEEVLTAYEIAEARLRAALPSYAALLQPEPLTLPAVQSLLDQDTVLLEYSLGEMRSFLWVVTSSGLESFALPGRAEVEDLARQAHELLSAPDPRDGAHQREVLARLGGLLLGPVEDLIRERRLAVVAAGALQYVPFAALILSSGEPVVGRHEVVSLPSAGVLRELRRGEGRPAAGQGLAVLADPVFGPDDPRLARAAGPGASAALPNDLRRAAGDRAAGFPRLPWTRREAESAAAEAGPDPVLLALDFQASRELATSPELARYRLLHFATHGVVHATHPELSGLVLSLVNADGRPRDGFLRLPDIYNLELGAELVVLSGCRTALGREIRGEGLMGLTRGFFYAGAGQVMASLWPVRDRATAELMARFYRGLFREGLSPAAALREAQLSLLREPRWRDPYHWAGFSLQGDWCRWSVPCSNSRRATQDR